MRRLNLSIALTIGAFLVAAAEAQPVANLPLTCPSSGAIGQPQNNCSGIVYQSPTNDQLIVLRANATWARAADLASSDTLAVCSLPVEPGTYSSCRDASGVRRIAYVAKSTVFSGSQPPPPPPPPPPSSGAARVIDLSTRPVQITEPGLYVLDRDWNIGPGGPSIVIASDYVTLDLRGHRLVSSFAIIQVSAGRGFITIRNGMLQIDGGIAIDTPPASTVIVDSMRVLGPRGTGVRLLGSRSILTNSVITSSDSMTGVVAGDGAVVRGNFISSRFRPLSAASNVTVADNEIDCGLDSGCIEIEGTNTVVSGNRINDRGRNSDVLIIRGNANHVLNNVFHTPMQENCSLSGRNRAIVVEGRGNTIRNNLVPACSDGLSGWDNGITFLQDGNFYGGNAVWATTPFNVGATTQIDQGGNVGVAR